VLGIIVLLLVVTNLACAQSRQSELPSRRSGDGNGWHHRLGPGKLGAVASESSICSRHGTDMLEMGGNAADAVRSRTI
jgi:gamma-glutamyltranspeptidase/glutathione hydrolase